jgi:hypothetical protein
MHEVTTLAELDTLDVGLMVSGYRAAGRQDPDYSQRDKSYWHGYLNGLADYGYTQPSAAQRQLAHAAVAQQRSVK